MIGTRMDKANQLLCKLDKNGVNDTLDNNTDKKNGVAEKPNKTAQEENKNEPKEPGVNNQEKKQESSAKPAPQ
jgi:hypothetical protein